MTTLVFDRCRWISMRPPPPWTEKWGFKWPPQKPRKTRAARKPQVLVTAVIKLRKVEVFPSILSWHVSALFNDSCGCYYVNFGRDCSTAVREVQGLNPDRCWAFFLFLLSPFYFSEVSSFTSPLRRCNPTYFSIKRSQPMFTEFAKIMLGECSSSFIPITLIKPTAEAVWRGF